MYKQKVISVDTNDKGEIITLRIADKEYQVTMTTPQSTSLINYLKNNIH